MEPRKLFYCLMLALFACLQTARANVITPGNSASLKPGGMHFMLIGLRKALVQGDTVQLSLRLQTGAMIPVSIAVRLQ